MPTLRAMFRLYDGYTSVVDRINRSNDDAAEKMSRTSRAADDVNKTIKKSGKSSESAVRQNNKLGQSFDGIADSARGANNSILKLVGAIASLAAVKKGMDITDDFINSTARLSMINDGQQTPGELQVKVFEAASRSRGGYNDMAAAVAKMNLLAGDSFSSNDEAIGFTEILQKSLKVSGAGTSEQQSAFLQLTQAMAAGKLQGDEFRSVMENAPMVAEAIARYMGKTKGELKELSSQGLITADIIKNAMFEAGEDIEAKFAQMPMTFADVGTLMANNLLQKFGTTMEKINGIANSGGFRKLLDAFNSLVDKAAGGVNQLTDAFIRGDPVVKAFFATAVIGAAVWAAAMITGAVASLAAVWPLLLIAGVIVAVILGLNQMGMTFAEIFGGIGAVLGGFYAVVYNIIAGVWNLFISLAEFITNLFNDPVGSIINLFVNMGISIMEVLQSIAKAVDDLFGTSFASEIGKTMALLRSVGDSVKKDNYKSLDDMRMQTKDIMDTALVWQDKGSLAGNFLDEWDFGIALAGKESGPGLGTLGNPAVFKGTGNGGKVEVDMADEDIQFLRDLAQRDYIANIATNTLAPNIRVEFTGQINRDVDLDSLGSKVGMILRDELERAPEGVY